MVTVTYRNENGNLKVFCVHCRVIDEHMAVRIRMIERNRHYDQVSLRLVALMIACTDHCDAFRLLELNFGCYHVD